MVVSRWVWTYGLYISKEFVCWEELFHNLFYNTYFSYSSNSDIASVISNFPTCIKDGSKDRLYSIALFCLEDTMGEKRILVYLKLNKPTCPQKACWGVALQVSLLHCPICWICIAGWVHEWIFGWPEPVVTWGSGCCSCRVSSHTIQWIHWLLLIARYWNVMTMQVPTWSLLGVLRHPRLADPSWPWRQVVTGELSKCLTWGACWCWEHLTPTEALQSRYPGRNTLLRLKYSIWYGDLIVQATSVVLVWWHGIWCV